MPCLAPLSVGMSSAITAESGVDAPAELRRSNAFLMDEDTEVEVEASVVGFSPLDLALGASTPAAAMTPTVPPAGMAPKSEGLGARDVEDNDGGQADSHQDAAEKVHLAEIC